MQLNTDYKNSLNNYVIVNTTPQETKYDPTIAEYVINWLGHSHVLPKSIDVNKDQNVIREYMRYLDAKISAVRKTTTFWDSYNIRDAAVSQIDFINKYAALPNNSSLIINSDSFKIGDTTYNKGSVVLKDFYGNQQIIEGKQNGFYVPSSLTTVGTGNFKLTFEYRDYIERESTIDFKAAFETPKDGTLYNKQLKNNDFINNSYSIDLIPDKDNTKIIPFIECYTYNHGKIGEQLFNFLTISKGDSQVILTKPDTSINFIVLIK